MAKISRLAKADANSSSSNISCGRKNLPGKGTGAGAGFKNTAQVIRLKKHNTQAKARHHVTSPLHTEPPRGVGPLRHSSSANMHQLPQRQSHGRAPRVALACTEASPAPPKNSRSISSPRTRNTCGAPHQQREANPTPGATESLGGLGSAKGRLRRSQAGERVAASQATGAAVGTAAVTATEAAAEAVNTNLATKTKKANKVSEPAEGNKTATKAVKVQAPSVRRCQNAAKLRPSEWSSKETGRAGARACGEASGRGCCPEAASDSLCFGLDGVFLEGRAPTLTARPRRYVAHTLHSLFSRTTPDEEDAAKAILELSCQGSCLVPAPPRSSSSSGSSRRRGSSSSKKTTGSSRTKGGRKKCASSVNSSSSSDHTCSGTSTSDRETSSAKLSNSKNPPLGQPRPRKLWEELQNSSRHIYAEAQDRYKSERDKFLFERSRFRRLDLGNFKVNRSEKAHEASDIYLLQGLVFLHELNMFSSLLRARQEGTMYELHGLK